MRFTGIVFFQESMGRKTRVVNQQLLWKSGDSSFEKLSAIKCSGMACTKKPNHVKSGPAIESRSSPRCRAEQGHYLGRCEHGSWQFDSRVTCRRNGQLRRSVHSLRDFLLLLPPGMILKRIKMLCRVFGYLTAFPF